MQKRNKPGAVVPVPTEDAEQMCLFRWAAYEKGKWPELATMFHIPNEGKRGAVTAVRFKAMGLKAGVPDICLPVARGGYNVLFIELKRQKGGKLSENQREWIEALRKQGARAVVCEGWEAAREEIVSYLGGGKVAEDQQSEGLSDGKGR